MAPFHIVFLLSYATAIISPSFSRSVGPASPPSLNPGPINTNGKNYYKICDPARFANMKLDMDDFHYCDKSLPYELRVKDLIGQMALTEKVGQLGDKAEGIQRIALPPYNWWFKALHGVGTGVAPIYGGIAPGATSSRSPSPFSHLFSLPPALLPLATISLPLALLPGVIAEGRRTPGFGHSRGQACDSWLSSLRDAESPSLASAPASLSPRPWNIFLSPPVSSLTALLMFGARRMTTSSHVFTSELVVAESHGEGEG